MALRPGYQCVQDASQWQVMARRIQQQAPVREAGKVFNLGFVDKELCGPNIEHIRIWRELTMGIEGKKEKSPDPSKVTLWLFRIATISQMPHILTSATANWHLSEGNGPILARYSRPT